MTTIPIGKTADRRIIGLPLAYANRHGLVTGSTGTGKCWGRGTLMLMFDGTTKAVESIAVGDVLMGPDSLPRTVQSTTAGVGPLYRIIPVKGEPWVCNDVHVLPLRCTAQVGSIPKGHRVNVEVKDWLDWSASKKHIYKMFRAAVDFPAQPVPVDPYMVGLFAAGGSAHNPVISHQATDQEITDAITAHFGQIRIEEKQGSRSHCFRRDSDLWNVMQPYMQGERHLPQWAKANTRDARLQVLAGFLDGDGHLGTGYFELSGKYRALVEDIAFIARSLGFLATVTPVRKGIRSVGFEGDYWRLHISGDIDAIPVRLARKRPAARWQVKNVLNTGFSVEPMGEGEYFGFTLDGDHLCMLADFTVTHNTVSLQLMAEGFSKAGVPVFAADVKGDLSGIAKAAQKASKQAERARAMQVAWEPSYCPVRFWDAHRQHGLPIQTSADRMGSLLIARMLGLNQMQEGTLSIAFKRSADEGSGHLDLNDLRAELHEMLDMREETCQRYGNITSSSIAAIQREIFALEAQGAGNLFAEPGLDIMDLLEVRDGKGVINLLHADTLMESPKLYACLLLWLLTELFRVLPEAGDLDKPKLVFFFDEAHLLFRDAPPKLLETVERLVRLVRSKGVGVYFVTQSPMDVPDIVLAQLGNRIQHALRAYTPKDQRLVKASAKAFRPNKGVAVQDLITTMGVGTALVSFLENDGVPMPVELVKIIPPEGQIGPIDDFERETVNLMDPLRHRYKGGDPWEMGIAFQKRWRQERGMPTDDRFDSMKEEDLPSFVAGYLPEMSEDLQAFLAEQERLEKADREAEESLAADRAKGVEPEPVVHIPPSPAKHVSSVAWGLALCAVGVWIMSKTLF